MEITDFKSTHRELTKFIGSLLIILSVFSGYLIQRDIVSLLSEDIVIDEIVNSMQQPQTMFLGVTFKYGTMNLFWPVVITAIFVLIHFLLIKQLNIWNTLRSKESSISLDFDALNVYSEIQTGALGRLCTRFAILLPMFALVIHLASGVFLLLHINAESTSNPAADDMLIVMLLTQIVITTLSIVTMLRLPGAVMSILRKFVVR